MCQNITVYSANFDHRGGPVFYASLPSDCATGNGHGANRAADQKRLITILLDHAAAMKTPPWPYQLLGDRVACPIRVAHGPLGRPHLLIGDVRGPAISFSEGGGSIWAALCGEGFDIGIDMAAADEFQGEYPLDRVFHDQELHHAGRLTGGNVAKSAALLWSIKEAVVKALGCAFHLVAPRQVIVSPSRGGDRGYTFPVSLSGKALMRYPLGAHRSIWVRSYPLEQMWLSIALVNWHSMSLI
jgi:phosphopantetheinyl transferase